MAAAFLGSSLIAALPARAATLTVTASRADLPMLAQSLRDQPVPTTCAPGTNLVGGGGWTGRTSALNAPTNPSDPTQVPITPYWWKDSFPIDTLGNNATAGTTDPPTWKSEAQFGPMTEPDGTD